MKRSNLLLALILAFAFIVPAFGQFSTDMVDKNVSDGMALTFTASVDSLEADTSRVFGISKVDTDTMQFTALITGGTASTQKISAKLQVSADGTTFYDSETILTADSVTTILDKDISLDVRGPYARLIIWGAAGNYNGNTVAGYIYARKED